MLWYRAWLETRWRFVFGLGLLMCSAAAIVLTYPDVIKLLPAASQLEVGGALGRRVAERAALALDYRGYIWSQWLSQSMRQLRALFAVLLGTGGLLAQASGGGARSRCRCPSHAAGCWGSAPRRRSRSWRSSRSSPRWCFHCSRQLVATIDSVPS
jgi:hypothetical protein